MSTNRPLTAALKLISIRQATVASDVAVQQVLQELLPSRSGLGLDPLARDPAGDFLQRDLAFEHRLGAGRVPTGIALGEEAVVFAVFDQFARRDKRLRADIEAADMAEQQVLRIDRLAPHFRVEVQA